MNSTQWFMVAFAVWFGVLGLWARTTSIYYRGPWWKVWPDLGGWRSSWKYRQRILCRLGHHKPIKVTPDGVHACQRKYCFWLSRSTWMTTTDRRVAQLGTNETLDKGAQAVVNPGSQTPSGEVK